MPEAIVPIPKFEFNKYFVHQLNDGRVLLITSLGRIACLDKNEFVLFQKQKYVL